MTTKHIQVQSADYKPKSKQQDHERQVDLMSWKESFDCLAFYSILHLAFQLDLFQSENDSKT